MKRVLVIDDEMHVREVVQTCLEAIGGWDVLVAASAQEGLQMAIAEQPDAIVLDVMMPEMDGLACLRQLQANSNTAAIPVVLLTAKAYLTNPQQLPALGVAGAISKPFNPMLLADQVAVALGWRLNHLA